MHDTALCGMRSEVLYVHVCTYLACPSLGKSIAEMEDKQLKKIVRLSKSGAAMAAPRLNCYGSDALEEISAYPINTFEVFSHVDVQQVLSRREG